MKKIIVIFLLCLNGTSIACTTFLLDDHGHYYFGRNYDWITGNGMVMTNPRHVMKTSASDQSFTWVSKYGSISFNQYGKEFPTGGMNEKGLVVELMWLDETKYPVTDDRKEIGELQWIQYQLDNCATIEEVIASDKKLRIGETENTPLHFLVADTSGKVSTIEFLNGTLVAHRDESLPFPVLTNTNYKNSLQSKSKKNSSETAGNYGDNSIARFAKACNMIERFRKNGVKGSGLDHSFSILDSVAQTGYTKWSIVYDLTGKKIHFITSANLDKRTVDLASFSFDCTTSAAAVDINTGKGDVSSKFTKMSFDTNAKLVRKSVLESKSIIEVPEQAVDKILEFYKETACANKNN